MVRVTVSDSKWISENRSSFIKAYTMLSRIQVSFYGVPFEVHEFLALKPA